MLNPPGLSGEPFYHLSVLELGEIIYDKPSDNVASFLLMANGHSNFMSAIF